MSAFRPIPRAAEAVSAVFNENKSHTVAKIENRAHGTRHTHEVIRYDGTRIKLILVDSLPNCLRKRPVIQDKSVRSNIAEYGNCPARQYSPNNVPRRQR